jgi:hypothetical protein
VQKKKQHQCTWIQSQSRSSRHTPASTSKTLSRRAPRSASDLLYALTARLGLCGYPRGIGA